MPRAVTHFPTRKAIGEVVLDPPIYALGECHDLQDGAGDFKTR